MDITDAPKPASVFFTPTGAAGSHAGDLTSSSETAPPANAGKGYSHRHYVNLSSTATPSAASILEPPSYVLKDGIFVKENVAILPTGVAIKDAPKTFVVDPDTLVLGEVLGRGASSYVQAALHRPSGTPLALKVISLFDKSKRSQLVREIQALYDADCDCLVSFYGAYLRDGMIGIALELMDLGTLSRVLNFAPPLPLPATGAAPSSPSFSSASSVPAPPAPEPSIAPRRIPEPVLAAIAFQMLWALAYMKHDKRLHRDIKTTNCLVNSLGQVKLSDFGLSAELKNSIGMAATFTGTCKYMSPERIQHSYFSFAADTWSFGIVLLECALGRYPYAHKDTATYIAMAETIVESPAPALPAEEVEPRGRTFSAEFAQFLSGALKKNAEERLPPDILLGSPWFAKHGVGSLEDAILKTKHWLDGLAIPPIVSGVAAHASKTGGRSASTGSAASSSSFVSALTS